MRPWVPITLAVCGLGLAACDESELKHAERLNAVTVTDATPSSVTVAKGAYRGAPDTPLTDRTRAVLVERMDHQRDGFMELGAGNARIPQNSAAILDAGDTRTAISGRESHQNF